jgi:hypothetical protein
VVSYRRVFDRVIAKDEHIADEEDKGFIVLVTKGNWYHRKAHEWRLTTKPMQTTRGKQVATNDWYFWKPQQSKQGVKTDASLKAKRLCLPMPEGRAGNR